MNGNKMKEFEYDLPLIETYLNTALRPVKPRSGFVDSLSERLDSTKLPRFTPKELIKYSFIGLIGFLSSVIILVTGIRAVMTLIGMISSLEKIKSPIQEDKSRSIEPLL